MYKNDTSRHSLYGNIVSLTKRFHKKAHTHTHRGDERIIKKVKYSYVIKIFMAVIKIAIIITAISRGNTNNNNNNKNTNIAIKSTNHQPQQM